MNIVCKSFVLGSAIGLLVWTARDDLKKLVEQLNVFAFAFRSSFVKILFAGNGVIFRDAGQKLLQSWKSLLVARVQFQTFVGALIGQMIAPLERIRFSRGTRSWDFCHLWAKGRSTS